MSVTFGRQAANGNDGVNKSQSVKAGTVDGVGGNVERVVSGTTNEVDIVQCHGCSHSPARFGQHLLRLLPSANRAIIIELGEINLVLDATIVVAAHHNEMSLRGHHSHVTQANRQGIQFGPTRDAVILLRGTIHFVNVTRAVVATHEVNVVTPSHHLVSLQGLGQVGGGTPVGHGSQLLFKMNEAINDDIQARSFQEIICGMGEVSIRFNHQWCYPNIINGTRRVASSTIVVMPGKSHLVVTRFSNV